MKRVFQEWLLTARKLLRSFRTWLRAKIVRQEIGEFTAKALPFWIASFLTALAAVGYANLFNWAEDVYLHWLSVFPWFPFVAAPVAFCLSRWLVIRFAPNASGSGIPQLMAAIDLATPRNNRLIGRFLSVRIGIVKCLSSTVLLLGGGAIGREGPTLQVAGSIFQLVYSFLPPFWYKISRKFMLITGGAAGLAAAFNTPLGGIVYVVEELTRTHLSYFRNYVFTAVIIAGLTSQTLLGPYLYLGYPKVARVGLEFEWMVALASIGAGILGCYFSKALYASVLWKEKYLTTGGRHWLFTLGAGLVFATLVYFYGPYVTGSGKEVMNDILFQHTATMPLFLVFLRFAGSFLCYASGGAGGIFAPSLATGAAWGFLMAESLPIDPANKNLIVLVSMVAFLTAVTRSPFTSAVLVLEMTDRHSVIFHLMLAGVLSNLVAMAIDRHSFYEKMKERMLHRLLVPSPDAVKET